MINRYSPDWQIRDLQFRLNELGFDAGPLDGIWGPQTQTAIETFQRSNGLPVTGFQDDNGTGEVLWPSSAMPPAPPNSGGGLPFPVNSGTGPTVDTNPPPKIVNIPGPTNAPIPGTTTADQSARAIIDAALSAYGLSSLSSWAWERYLAGVPVDMIMFEMRQRPEYAARFPAMAALANAGHAITESQYIGYEVAATNLMRQYGLPVGFFDQPDDFTQLLSSQVSIAELSQRLASYNDIANAQDPLVLQEAERMGITTGDLAAFFIDADRALPLLERKAQAALTGTAAIRTGFGQLSVEEAERYAGVNAAGFSTLAGMKEVFAPLPGEGTDQIGRTEQLAAAFDQDAGAQSTIQTRQRRRTAEFEAGGTYAGGGAGIGSSSR